MTEEENAKLLEDTLTNLDAVREGIEKQTRLIQGASDLLHRAWRMMPHAREDGDSADETYRWYRDTEAWWRDAE
jgi:hypothetical protein